VVAPVVWARFPGLTIVVAVGQNLDPQHRPDAVSERWRAAWIAAGEAGRAYPNPQSHPRVAPWREAFRAMGVPPREFPSSIEALLRRAMKGGEPFSVSPLVDFYNAVSLSHFVPVGAFDLDRLSHSAIRLRLTRTGDHYFALDAAEPVFVDPGEVAYTDGDTVLTRHFVWRQAREGLIRPETQNVFLVSEILGAVGRHVAEIVLGDVQAGLLNLFASQAKTFILDLEHPAAAW
jgi:DNA/RNA-binding domain of Phe-tRNA-synthetase-like protein